MLFRSSLSHLKISDSQEDIDVLIERISNKDTEALAQLYKKTSSAVYGFALSVLKNTCDAEDVLHDTYVSVYSNASGYKSQGKPMAWILTITRNLCLLKFRHLKKSQDILEEDWEKYLSQKQEISVEDKLVLSLCMEKLSDEERQIVVLHAVGGFKHREIGEILDLALPTVLSKYNRAIKKLKKLLLEE